MHSPALRTVFILLSLVTISSQSSHANDHSLTTDLQDGLATADFTEGRIQWKVLVAMGGGALRLDEELLLEVDGDNIEILCTVENLRDPEIPLRDVKVEILPPARQPSTTPRVARAAGPGGSRSGAAAAALDLRPLPTLHKAPRVARGGRTPTQASNPQASTETTSDDSYRQQLRATRNTGFVSMVEEQGYEQGLQALNIVNPTAQGRWRVKITGVSEEAFVVVARATPVELSEDDAAILLEASGQMVESIGTVLEEIEKVEREPVVATPPDDDAPRVAMGVLDSFKCGTCCKCEWSIKLAGIASALNSVCGKKARREIMDNEEVKDRIQAVLVKVVSAAADVMGFNCGKEIVLAIILERDLFCMIDNGERFFCYLVPEMVGRSGFCSDPCEKKKDDDVDEDDEPPLPVDPDLDQDWLTQTGQWQSFDRDLVCAQTFTVGKRGILRGIELGISQQHGGADEEIRLQIARVDGAGRPSREGQDVILQQWIHRSAFSTRGSNENMGPGQPGKPGGSARDERDGGAEMTASIDLLHDAIQVFPGEKLAIIVTHRGSRAFEWFNEAGYDGGQGYTRPIRGGGWTDRGTDFSFRTYVVARGDSPASSAVAEWVPDTRKSHPVWNRDWAAQTLVVPQGGLVEAIELGICRTPEVKQRLRVEIRQVDARGMPDGEVLFSDRYETDMFPAAGEKSLARIDVLGEQIVVEAGQRLAIAVRNDSGDAYEWWYLDGYEDGQGYVEGSSGWMDWKCDFSFRVKVSAN